MKKVSEILISMLLCIAVLLSITSCDYINGIINPQSNTNSDTDTNTTNTTNTSNTTNKKDRIVPIGYTGGLEFDLCFHEVYAVYWLETYDEVLSAVELLKSHGSTIKRSMAFNCEGDFLDVKFCFLYQRSKAEKLEDGKNFFDRKIDDGEFIWFALFDNVSIDELMYNDTIEDYDFMDVSAPGYYYRDFENVDNTDALSFDWFGKTEFGYEQPTEQDYYKVLYHDCLYAMIHFSESFIPVEYHDEFLSTFVIIE